VLSMVWRLASKNGYKVIITTKQSSTILKNRTILRMIYLNFVNIIHNKLEIHFKDYLLIAHISNLLDTLKQAPSFCFWLQHNYDIFICCHHRYKIARLITKASSRTHNLICHKEGCIQIKFNIIWQWGFAVKQLKQ
jgi:hypothetical protein